MGSSGSSVKPISVSTDSPPPECPVHKKTPTFSPPASVSGECPASFGANQPVMTETDIDPKNMVSMMFRGLRKTAGWFGFSCPITEPSIIQRSVGSVFHHVGIPSFDYHA